MDVQEPGRIPGPIEEELFVRFDVAERETKLIQRWDNDRSSPTEDEWRVFVLAALTSVKTACLQLACEADAMVEALNALTERVRRLEQSR